MLKELACNVINRAVRDLSSVDETIVNDAEMFFRMAAADGPQSVWFDLVGLKPQDAIDKVLWF